jgi:succinate dehydrogenase flavin-adding protein (antitoxin of CptAB toxin-antitoxin module)
MLQYHQDKFSHKENAGFCKICKDGDEDIEHFILKCKPLDEVRQNKLEQFKRTVGDIKGGGAELLEEKNLLLQAILDCTSKNVYTIITNNHDDLKAIERASQNLCFELHRLRTKLYCELR